jgi:hypothetical protein
MKTIFLEIVLDAQAMVAGELLSRDEIEDPLSEALEKSGLGEVTGGGGGAGRYIIDVEVSEAQFDEALEVVRSALRDAGAPSGTVIMRHQPHDETFALS